MTRSCPAHTFLTRPVRALVNAALVALASLLVLPLSSAPSVSLEDEYILRVWTTDDGLPHNSINEIIQDAQGFLWFATLGGLGRFDGRDHHEMATPRSLRLLGFNIRGVVEERPGCLVVLPTNGRIMRLSAGEWEEHPASAYLTSTHGIPMKLHVDGHGVLWVSTSEGFVLRWSPEGTCRIFSTGVGPAPAGRRITFAADDEGRTLIAVNERLFVDDDAALKDVTESSAEPMIIAGGRGHAWICTARSLRRLEHRRTISEAEEVPWKDELGAVRQLFEDSRSNLWIASTRTGLWCYSGGRFRSINVSFASITAVREDNEGNIWVGTDGAGVIQIREKAHQIYGATSGLKHGVVSSVAGDSTGRVFLANRTGGIAWVGPGRTLARADELPSGQTYVNVVALDSEDRLWYGGGRRGLSRWSPVQGTAPVRLPEPEADLHVLCPTSNGDMWFSADPQIVGFYRNDLVHRVTGAEEASIRCIAEDHAGGVWLGGSRGELFRWDGTNLERCPAAESVPQYPVHDIFVDAANRLWIGTAGGLILRDQGRSFLLTREHGLADDIILSVVEDSMERLWMASRRGIFYVQKSELVEAAQNSSARVHSHLYGSSQGIKGLTPIANFRPAALRAKDGSLWFATSQGALRIDPTKLPHKPPPPTALIDQVRINGTIAATRQPLRIPSGRNRIDFRIVVPSYTSPDDVQVRHHLEGMDPTWDETDADRVITYTNLEPGNYRLRVAARNSGGAWSPTEATLSVTVVPNWWETRWARTAALILLLGLSAGSARLLVQRRLKRRLRRLEQEHALEKERMRIARDLHDDLGSALTEMGMLAERLRSTPTDSLERRLSDFAWRTRRLATDLSGIVWALSPRNSTLDRLADFLRRYTQRLFQGTAITCMTTVAEGIPAAEMSPEKQHHLIAATKEALNNVIRHSEANELKLDVGYDGGRLAVTITDNGRGFPATLLSNADGNGLRNIRTRMTDIGGEAAINSAPGAGTTVKLTVGAP